MIRTSRTKSLLIRKSQARRRAEKQNGKAEDGCGKPESRYNFTADLKGKIDFSSGTGLFKMATEEPEGTEKPEIGGDKKADEKAEVTQKQVFPASRTIMSAVARKDLELLDELLSTLPPKSAEPTAEPTAQAGTDESVGADEPPNPADTAEPNRSEDTTIPNKPVKMAETATPLDTTEPKKHADMPESAIPAITARANVQLPGLTAQAELNHALMLAITNKDAVFVKRLLTAGADVHYFDNIYPMMLFAVDNRAMVVFDLLLEHSKSPDVNSMCGNLTHAAARTGDIDILKRAVDLGLDINTKAKSSQTTPLHDAVRSVRFVAKRKPETLFTKEVSDIEWNSQMPAGDSKCRKRGHTDEDSNMTKTSEKTETPVMSDLPAPGYDMRCIDYLIANGSELNATDVNGRTALHEAAIVGNMAVAKRLIEAGADINIADVKHHTPIMYAIAHNHFVDIAGILCGESTLHEPVTERGEYYIHLACAARNVKVLRYLVSRNCDINVIYDGMTPLMYAFREQQFSCAEILLESPECDVTFQNANGQSALSILCQNTTMFTYREKLLKILISRGVDINQSDASGYTPLFTHIRSSNERWVKCLLENGADVNFLSISGAYPLLLACNLGNNDMVRTLILSNASMTMTSRVCHDANVVARDYAGKTPLQIALRRGDASMVTSLLSAGCSMRNAAKWLGGEEGRQSAQNFNTEYKHLLTYIQSTLPTPGSLQELARCKIRTKTGAKDAILKYDQLPLPRLLKKYLDLDTCLSETTLFLESFRAA